MNAFLTTVAQVSFTLAGLIIVAIAADSETRHYWIGYRHRRSYAYISLLLVTLPGVVSIFGLIPQSAENSIPSWGFSALIIGIIYLLLAIVVFFKKKDFASTKELRELDEELSSPFKQLGVNAIFLITVAIMGFSIYRELAQILLGIMFGVSISSGILSVIDLLRSQELSNQKNLESLANKSDDIIDGNSQEQDVNENILPDIQEDRLPPKKESISFQAIVSILTAIIAFLLGMLVAREPRS